MRFFLSALCFLVISFSYASRSDLHCTFILKPDEIEWEFMVSYDDEILFEEHLEKRELGPFSLSKDFCPQKNTWLISIKKVSNYESGYPLNSINATFKMGTNQVFSPPLLKIGDKTLDASCAVRVGSQAPPKPKKPPKLQRIFSRVLNIFGR